MRALIIDGNNSLHRAYHKFKNMKSKTGKPSSVVYGFPYILSSLLRKFNPDAVTIAFDHSKNKHRLEALPGYKDREPRLDFDYEDFQEQFKIVRQLTNALGVDYIRVKGQEADDLIYMMVKEYRRKGYDDIIIISSDKDFHQLITPKVSIWNTYKGMFYTKLNYSSLFGYSIKQSVDYLILDGDASDKIPGYKGMGDKRIKDFLNNHSSIRKFLKSNETHKLMGKEELELIYTRNKLLIDIKFFCKNFMDESLIKITKGKKKIDHPTIASISNEFGINTFHSNTFLKPFKNLLKNDK